MFRIFIVICIVSLFSCNITAPLIQPASPFQTKFEKDENYSSTYFEAIEFYKRLDAHSSMVKVNEFGMTDSGHPLHEVILSKDQLFSPLHAIQSNKSVLLINNAIHAGEPCGIDASMLIARDIIESKSTLLDSVIVVIIPVYNIGGSLNRGSYSRANQNGPKAYGFRGNAKNLDLNRDFIKMDSENARSFNQLFNKWNPDVFMDNHTSNGADYQYVITLIATQKDKLESNLSAFMENEMLPVLYSKMDEKNYEMTPYVYARSTPDEGIASFLDLPRYSSGYAALHNTISFMPETHMFKPYKDRVKSTYFLMEAMLEFMNASKAKLQETRSKANEATQIKKEFDLNWTLDFENADVITFKGYESKTKLSKVTGLERRYYDQTKPFTKEIPYFKTYKSTLSIKKPDAYLIPGTYTKVIDQMKLNNVKIEKVSEEKKFQAEVYYIDDLKTGKNPFEGHYLHTNVEVEVKAESILAKSGDFIIRMDQKKNNFIVATLEPQAPDSYFAWNYFDAILGQKEYFSAYVFEEIAEQLLKNDKDLKADFEEKRKNDEEFRKSAYMQLDYIYKRSPHYEQSHRRYPIIRLTELEK